ncbi:coiled-coil domain-containing protein [Brumimicrobium aurantiacum]|uniref:Uncharacterized protein n=1 Tax=Brumimicrobium aurantiacum TaxID=1737063 RepID=A0A3E1EZ85_9FLAO|nr:hypothetical protein [Brumimicrobium aurantiacum]RFC54865.1 hypothetical protein DXU93_03325 [Brumimicrobium aurantiacum]
MYQIPKKQLAVKLSDFERNQLQEVSDQLQEKLETTFSNGNHVVFGILQELKSLETKVKSLETDLETAENNLITAETKVKSLENELESVRNQSENSLETAQKLEASERQLNDLLAERLRHDESEKNKTEKETEADPVESNSNEIKFELSSDELEMAELVRSNRSVEFKKQKEEPETLTEMFKNCFFDSGNLISFNGGWYTGVK